MDKEIDGWLLKIIVLARQLQLMRIAYHAGFNKGEYAGATAMLEALRKNGAHYEKGETANIEFVCKSKSGTWVFIPDDKEE